jgi:large conductance mechanosensitive channel
MEKKGIVSEFKDFLLRGNVVDLAVAVVIGAAFGAVVTSFVGNLLTPLIAAIFGEQDFSDLTFTINGSVFRYGAFVNSIISFVTIAAAVFFVVVKPVNALQARRARGEEPEPEAPRDEVRLLTEIRDVLQTR